MKTMIDLETTAGFPTEGIFSKTIKELPTARYLDDYSGIVDNVLYTHFGNRILFSSLDFSDNADVVTMYILAVAQANEYKWKHLIATTTVDYNPIENYSMTEESITTDVKKENSDTQQTIVNGERISEKSSTNSVAPYDDESLKTESKQTENLKDNSFTDRNDTSLTYTTDNTRKDTLKRSGNIGVTTSQQMLESERAVANFSIAKIIAKDVANAITKGVYYDL